jgi:hypothetical protein
MSEGEAMKDKDDSPGSSGEADQEAILRQIFRADSSPLSPQPKQFETEQDWLTTTDLTAMLFFLQPRVTRRKPLLLAAAGCRRIWHRITDARLQELVEVAERLADGKATERDLRRAAKPVSDPGSGNWSGACYSAVTGLAELKAHPMAPANYVTKYAPLALCKEADSIRTPESRAIIDGEQAVLAGLIRDIFGNPFRPVVVAPSCLTPQVVALAQAVYDQRELPAGTLDVAQLAVLADALEEAGCDNANLLTHLRGPGPHVRGCWAVDLLLGKE